MAFLIHAKHLQNTYLIISCLGLCKKDITNQQESDGAVCVDAPFVNLNTGIFDGLCSREDSIGIGIYFDTVHLMCDERAE
jgi:hypothetical protein